MAFSSHWSRNGGAVFSRLLRLGDRKAPSHLAPAVRGRMQAAGRFKQHAQKCSIPGFAKNFAISCDGKS